MSTSFLRRGLLVALFFVVAPLSALAQDVDMVIGAVVDPNPVVAGSNGGADNQTWTITITNNGPSDATGVSVITPWTLPTGVTPTGNTPDVGLYDYNLWDVGPVASGTSLNLEVVLSVAANAEVCTNCIQLNNAEVSSTETETAPTDNLITIQASIDREFDLGLAVVDAPDPVLAGSGTGNLTHTFTLSRSGPSDAAGVAVELVPTLPVGVTLDGAVASIGSVVGTTWTVGDWPAAGNGTDQTLTLTLTVPSSVGSCTDCISAQGTVSATSGTDTNADNNVAIDPTSVTAASDITTTFATSIDFTNDDDSTVTAMLTCNAGIPLTQSFDISEGSPVNFTVTNLPFTTAGTTCEITVDGLGDAYMLAPESCLYEVGGFAEDGMNVCAFVASPMPTAVEVVTDFAGVEDPNIDTSFETMISCTGVSLDAAGPYDLFEDTVTYSPFTASWYADPDGGADCTITLMPMSSAAEGDMCEFSFMLGDEEAGCTVVATVFFEGIPTLSQYGMAIMVLLMLGVGFVGMRRFV